MKLLTLLFITVIFAGCAAQGPAPIVDYSQYFSKFKNNIVSAISNEPKIFYRNVRVKKGDTLYNLSKRYNVLKKDIVLLNSLKAPYHLNSGRILKLPLNYYKIQSGDTLYTVAKKHNVQLKYVALANNLSAPYRLEIGHLLRIPANNTADISAYGSGAVLASKVTSAKKSSNKVKKIVKKKEYVKEYSKKIAKKTSQKKAVKKTSQEITKKVVKKSAPSKPKKKVVKFAKSLGKTGRNAGRFYWPAKGKIISKFGAKKGGVQNDGINIASKKGAKITASDAGTVVFASNELKGYGNLIIIKHKSGWLTAYAHQKKFAVRNGQKVKKGQVIGYVGDTGNVTQPQLHFAMRKNGKSINPLKYLKI